MRIKADGAKKLATFKIDVGEDSGSEAERLRAEDEKEWACPICVHGKDCALCRGEDDFDFIIESFLRVSPVLRAKDFTGTYPLRKMFPIKNLRTDTHYAFGEHTIVFSEDEVGFSDGDIESRLEIELKTGTRRY